MRKFLSLIGWVLFGVIGAFSMLYMFTEVGQIRGSDYTPAISYGVYGVILMLLSGLCRRIFGIRKELVQKKGLWPAILTRLNCMRFYWSIFLYASIAVTLFFMGRQKDDTDMFIAIGMLIVDMVFFTIVRHSCPRCGHSLSHDGDSYGREIEIEFYDDHASGSQEKTSHYHCPRCGRVVRMRSKEVTKRYEYK